MNKIALALAVFVAMPLQQAFADTITYDFTSSDIGISIANTNAGASNYLRENDGSAAFNATVVYDEDTLTAVVTMASEGRVMDRTNGNNVIVNPTDFFAELIVTNVIPILAPEGLLGFAGLNAASTGSVTVNNFGDLNGDNQGDTVSYDIEAKFMNFANYANNATDYRSEIAHLGDANFFLWDSTILGGIASKAWFTATGNYRLNGQLTQMLSGGGGDFHLYGGNIGAEVPEPATALLLSFGLLGGAVRRKKSQA